MAVVRIATRRSALATAQARLVGDELVRRRPDLRIELVPVVTSGDLESTPIAHLSETGTFVRAVQRAVSTGQADIAVHSCKDLPTDGPPELVAYYPRRAAPWDVLCGANLADLPPGSRVGTGSPRRAAQLRLLRPDLVVAPIRGNVDTRLAKVAAGDFRAVVLAEAGLDRLGRLDAIDHRFTVDHMVPAPAQGVLAVEVRKDTPIVELVVSMEDPVTRRAVEAERLLLSLTGVGCRAALGAYAQVEDGRLRMWAFVEDEAGPRRVEVTGDDPTDVALHARKELGI